MYVRAVNAIKYQADSVTSKSGLMRKARESYRSVIFTFPMSHTFSKTMNGRALLKYTRYVFEQNIFPPRMNIMIDQILKTFPAPETPKSKRESDFEYFNRQNKYNRLHPQEPDPFAFNVFVDVIELCLVLYGVSLFVLIIERLVFLI